LMYCCKKVVPVCSRKGWQKRENIKYRSWNDKNS
jgi:hypothetical protein